MVGEVVKLPASAEPVAPAWAREGQVHSVSGWIAQVGTDAASAEWAPGERLLAANLRLLIGQRLPRGSAWWSVVGHDDDGRTLTMQHGSEVKVAHADDLLEENADRWWWHVLGSEHTARD
jgi:hypothetical protein